MKGGGWESDALWGHQVVGQGKEGGGGLTNGWAETQWEKISSASSRGVRTNRQKKKKKKKKKIGD